jgi:macrolide transport system ATP-binding/permease protein
MSLIEIKNIKKTYLMGDTEVKALAGVSLSISAGEFVAIMGPSGSGKSTLMHIIGLLDRPDSGSYLFEGKELTSYTDEQWAVIRNRVMGFIFQQFHLLPRMTALENVELPLIYAGKQHEREKARGKLELVGLKDRALHRPNELSGGQQQRVAIARALVNDPLIILADEPTGNLDSKSKDEIISLLKKFNEEGKTIVMVTHEPEMAVHAKRVILVRDGVIVSDKVTDAKLAKTQVIQTEDVISNLFITTAKHATTKFFDYFKQALSAMISHKMRSILSILGILIGVAAVIAMLALGEGAKVSIEKQLSSLGSNLLLVRAGSAKVQGVSTEAGTVTRFTFQDIAGIEKLTDDVARVSPSVTGRGQIVYGSKNWNTQVEGAGVGYEIIRSAHPTVGRFFTDDEVKMRDKVALIGLTVSKEIFGDVNPVGETIKINLINFKVIGLLPEKGGNSFRDQDDTVVIPITTAMYRVFGKEYIDQIYVEAKRPDTMDSAQNEVSKLIIKQHRLNKDELDSFQIRNMSDIKQALETTTKTMSLLLGSIAAISLLVGGIGIMNIMLVSVTERTREIGLRKAIGANNHDIMVQFLIESVLMSLIGGLSGIAIGTGVSILITSFAGWAVQVSLFSIVLSTGFSLLIGIVFGLWPAKQAAELDPISALRYE